VDSEVLVARREGLIRTRASGGRKGETSFNGTEQKRKGTECCWPARNRLLKGAVLSMLMDRGKKKEKRSLSSILCGTPNANKKSLPIPYTQEAGEKGSCRDTAYLGEEGNRLRHLPRKKGVGARLLACCKEGKKSDLIATTAPPRKGQRADTPSCEYRQQERNKKRNLAKRKPHSQGNEGLLFP